MENIKHLLVLAGFLPYVVCTNTTNGNVNDCKLGHILFGITIAIMSVAIICLSVALYMAKNNKTIFGKSIKIENPTYNRQESEPGVTLCNVTSNNNIHEQHRSFGSNLTVNSNAVEMNGLHEPVTPTRVEEKKKSYIKKPTGLIIPQIQKAQMDKIIEDVLNRRQKSDSATFRELDAIAQLKTLKNHDSEFKVKRNSASLNDLDSYDTEVDESLYGNALTINFMNRNKSDVKDKENTFKNDIPKIEVTKGSGIVKNESSSRLVAQNNEDEHEVYDTVPNPVRCMSSDDEFDDEVDNIPVYDLPPRSSWEVGENRNVVMDHDTQYLLPINKRVLNEEQEKQSYVNANVHRPNV